MKIPLFDRTALKIMPLSERKHDLDISVIRDLDKVSLPDMDMTIRAVAERIINAGKMHSAVILMMGAHVIRSCVQNYIIDLMQKRKFIISQAGG